MERQLLDGQIPVLACVLLVCLAGEYVTCQPIQGSVICTYSATFARSKPKKGRERRKRRGLWLQTTRDVDSKYCNTLFG